MNEHTHIIRCDDLKYLPFARSRIKALRAAGLMYGSQKFDIDGVQISVRVEGAHSFVSIGGGDVPLQMDSGIVDVGATTSMEQFLPGERKSIPSYESSFTRQVGATPWYLNPTKSNEGQLAGVITVGSKVTGKTRKDTVAESFACQTTGTDENGERIANGADETLLAKKKAGVYCPASMFTGRARLYVQAMYGQPLYDKKAGDKADVAQPTPTANLNGMPTLGLVAYTDPNTERREAFNIKVGADRKAHEDSGSLLPFADPYAVSLTTSSGVYFDRVSRQHWLINPAYGSVTIYPLKASTDGESSRKWLREGKLPTEEFERMEAYILSTCKPHVEVAETFTVTEITPWASGYGWHWNWSGTVADMVQVRGAQSRSDNSMESTHYRLSVTAVFDTASQTTAWSVSAGAVSGPRVWATQTPVCCVTHPNWSNRYVGDDMNHPAVYWSEKLSLNHEPTLGDLPDVSSVPIYAFYKKDELQVVTFTHSSVNALAPYMDYSEHYVLPVPDGGPIDYVLQRLSYGNADAFLRVTEETSARSEFTISCGGHSARVVHGAGESGYYIEDSSKSEITSTPAINSPAFFGLGTITLRTGREPYDVEYVYAPEGGFSYPGTTFYSTSTYTNKTGNFTKDWYGTAGGIIPFYDAEAFYLVQDTWRETINNVRQTRQQSGNFFGHDRGLILSPTYGGYSTSYAGWSRFEMLAAGSATSSYSSEPDETIRSNEATQLVAVFSTGIISAPVPPSSTYAMFEDGGSNYVAETFNTIASAGSEGHFMGLVTKNWPDMPGLRNPVIVGWV